MLTECLKNLLQVVHAIQLLVNNRMLFIYQSLFFVIIETIVRTPVNCDTVLLGRTSYSYYIVTIVKDDLVTRAKLTVTFLWFFGKVPTKIPVRF